MKLCTAMMFALVAAGCGAPAGPGPAREVVDTLAVTILADSAQGGGLPPARLGSGGESASLTLVRIASGRAGVGSELPEPEPSAPAPDGTPAEGLARDDDLRPPIARGEVALRLPAGSRGWVELDVRVDERGEVTDARVAGGDAGAPAVAAAVDAALRTRWYPATRLGRPVAVWCRQRFEFGPGR